MKKATTLKPGKVVVVNFSGNVGKTTVAKQLLSPRMSKATAYAVETINAGASDDAQNAERLKGKEYGSLQEDMLLADEAIVDVGASNVEQFMQAMGQYRGSHEDFDGFIVPTTPERKQQADTINTIKALATLGVPPEKITVVFNKVDIDDSASLHNIFPALFGFHEAENLFTLRPQAVIYSNELYDRLRVLKKTVSELAADETDYRQALRDTPDKAEKTRLTRLIAGQRLAKSANENLDTVFHSIFG
jgi:MinD-like ATPase involved in chromosome partitioning or flagellar assembly